MSSSSSPALFVPNKTCAGELRGRANGSKPTSITCSERQVVSKRMHERPLPRAPPSRVLVQPFVLDHRPNQELPIQTYDRRTRDVSFTAPKRPSFPIRCFATPVAKAFAEFRCSASYKRTQATSRQRRATQNKRLPSDTGTPGREVRALPPARQGPLRTRTRTAAMGQQPPTRVLRTFPGSSACCLRGPAGRW